MFYFYKSEYRQAAYFDMCNLSEPFTEGGVSSGASRIRHPERSAGIPGPRRRSLWITTPGLATVAEATRREEAARKGWAFAFSASPGRAARDRSVQLDTRSESRQGGPIPLNWLAAMTSCAVFAPDASLGEPSQGVE